MPGRIALAFRCESSGRLTGAWTCSLADERAFRDAWSAATSLTGLCVALRLAPNTKHRSALAHAGLGSVCTPCRACGQPASRPREPQLRASPQELARLAQMHPSMAAMLAELGVLDTTSARCWLRTLLGTVGVTLPPGERAYAVPDSEFFVEGIRRSNAALRVRLVKSDLIPHEHCAECGQGQQWNGRVLVLELDHANGDSSDNRLTNLRFLCPNCHSQTPTFRNRSRAVPEA